MLNRTNLLIVLLALASAGLGLGLSMAMRPAAAPAPSPAQAPAAETRTPPALGIGDSVGDLGLPDVSGKMRRLDEWNGKLVLLNFWASWCGPCREEMPLLDALHQRSAGEGISVIGVAVESASDAGAYLATNPVSYPILINAPDEGIDWPLLFGDHQSVLPYSVLIGRDGRLLATRIGDFSPAELDDWLKPHRTASRTQEAP